MLFLDTCALLLLQEDAFLEPFIISSRTLMELEDIKTSGKKDEETRYKARHACRLLLQHEGEYDVAVENVDILNELTARGLPHSPDNIIMQTAAMIPECEFVTADVVCRLIACNVFGLNVRDAKRQELEVYNGYKQIQMCESEYNTFLSSLNENPFGCLINEYLIVYDNEYEVREVFKWTADGFVVAYSKPLRSFSMGDKIKPKDEFQRCAIDSLMTNTITILSGRAGSGKSLLALSALMHQVDAYKLEKVVVTSNPVPARGCKEIGFLPGSANDKLLGGNLGNILTSKFGDRMQVEMLIQQNKLRLLDISACRGSEIKSGEALFLTEAQNTSIDIMKILLSRVSSGAKVVIDGDFKTQLDNSMFAGENNGLLRAINVFKGSELFGTVNLPNVHRSKIAELAEKL